MDGCASVIRRFVSVRNFFCSTFSRSFSSFRRDATALHRQAVGVAECIMLVICMCCDSCCRRSGSDGVDSQGQSTSGTIGRRVASPSPSMVGDGWMNERRRCPSTGICTLTLLPHGSSLMQPACSDCSRSLPLGSTDFTHAQCPLDPSPSHSQLVHLAHSQLSCNKQTGTNRSCYSTIASPHPLQPCPRRRKPQPLPPHPPARPPVRPPHPPPPRLPRQARPRRPVRSRRRALRQCTRSLCRRAAPSSGRSLRTASAACARRATAARTIPSSTATRATCPCTCCATVTHSVSHMNDNADVEDERWMKEE